MMCEIRSERHGDRYSGAGDGNRSGALARAEPHCQKIPERSAGSGRAAFLHRCVEHVRGDRRHHAAWLGIKYGIRLARACWTRWRRWWWPGVIIWIGSRLGKKTLDALLDVAPGGLQRTNHAGRGRHRRRAEHGAGARAKIGAALLRGCDHQRAAHGQSGAGARCQRCGGTTISRTSFRRT